MTWKERIQWVIAHWYVPFSLFLSGLLYGVFRRGGHATASEKLNVELAAVSSRLEVSAIDIKHGKEAAMLHVQQAYAGKLANLTEQEAHDADRLRHDPAALAAYLMRASAQSGGSGSKPVP